MEGIKVIFFDMGNTLLHFHHGKSDREKDLQGLKYLTKHLNKINPNITLKEIECDFFDKWMDGIKLRKEKFIEYPIEDFLNNFLNKYNLNFTLEQCIEAINIFYTDYKEQLHFEEKLFETLSKIKNKGYKVGIISNTCYYDEVMKECFKKANIYDLIDNFTFSYSLRVGKPQKAIFENAIESMMINPREAVMVGDSLEKDIKPALELGMKGIWFNQNHNKNNTGIMPDFEISTISEIHKYI